LSGISQMPTRGSKVFSGASMTKPSRVGAAGKMAIARLSQTVKPRLASGLKVGVGIEQDTERNEVAFLEAGGNAFDQRVFPAVRMDMVDLAEISCTTKILDDMFIIRPLDHQYAFASH
jgi:hypothetical protein